MKTKRANKLWTIGFALCGATWGIGAPARAQDVRPAGASLMTGVILPDGAVRVEGKSIPKEVQDALDAIIKGAGNDVQRGKTEVLVWVGGDYRLSHAAAMKADIIAKLKKDGWGYEESKPLPGAGAYTVVKATEKEAPGRIMMGFWTPTPKLLMLAWTEMVPGGGNAATGDNNSGENNGGDTAAPQATGGETTNDNTGGQEEAAAPEPAVEQSAAPAAPAGATVFDISPEQFTINVMKNAMPKMPSFPALKPRPGLVCGYVKDSLGKPLKGAVIGVRSTAVGGAETSASAKTDEKGYYEIMAPWGAAGFYNAGYTVDYGDGIAAVGLRPADGEADEFATPKGHVENWVLLPYGIADRAGMQDQPRYLNNYFGGSVCFQLQDENSMYSVNKIPFGSTVILTFTPQGALIDGSRAKTIVVRKTIQDGGEKVLYVNNIPYGSYRLSGRLQNGRALHFQETGPDRGTMFGLNPKQANGSAGLLFIPYGAKADMVTAAHGHFKEVNIDVSVQ